MRQEDEQGFLAGKFDDWSGEPIPNGWNSIDRKIHREKIRRNILLGSMPALLLFTWLLSGLSSDQITHRSEMASGRLRQSENAASVSSGKANEAATVLKPVSSPSAASPSPVYAAAAVLPGRISAESSAEEGVAEKIAALPAGPVESTGSGNFPTIPDAIDGPGAEVSESPSAATAGFIDPKAAAFVLPEMAEVRPEPHTRTFRIHTQPVSSGWFSKSFSLQAAYAVSSIEIDPALSGEWKYSAAGSNFTKAGMIAAGIRMEKPVQKNLILFYGLDAGLFARESSISSTRKMPLSYCIRTEGESRFSVSPEISTRKETRRTALAFVSAELGARQALTRRSGLLAAARIWTAAGSRGWSDQSDCAAFSKAGASYALGYRAGAWMQTGPFTQLELAYSSMPEQLAPSTSGIRFRTGLLGLSLRQNF